VILAGLWVGPTQDTAEERYYDLNRPNGGGAGIELLRAGLAQAGRELHDAGKRVFIAEDVPYWVNDPARISFIEGMWLPAARARGSEPNAIRGEGIAGVRQRNAAIDQAVSDVAQSPGASFIELVPAFCSQGSCRYREGSALYYADRSHLTLAGALHALEPY